MFSATSTSCTGAPRGRTGYRDAEHEPNRHLNQVVAELRPVFQAFDQRIYRARLIL